MKLILSTFSISLFTFQKQHQMILDTWRWVLLAKVVQHKILLFNPSDLAFLRSDSSTFTDRYRSVALQNDECKKRKKFTVRVQDIKVDFPFNSNQIPICCSLCADMPSQIRWSPSTLIWSMKESLKSSRTCTKKRHPPNFNACEQSECSAR